MNRWRVVALSAFAGLSLAVLRGDSSDDLTVYDLPDLVRALPPAKIDVADARDSDNRPVTPPAR